ncbi:MAG: hypothetical protein OXQ28_01130 [Acidobacteriota bacterium]|nr:hypothetical protein [Acidobacteriota bacterium]
MDAQDQLAIAQLCLSLALIVFALGYMRRRTRVDRYRESLFTLRDGLFDYMWKNDIPFDLHAYRLMRAFLNGAIRVAGSVTPLMFLVVMFAANRQGPVPVLSVAIDEIEDPGIREHFRQTRSDFVDVLLVFLGPVGTIIRLAIRLERFKRAVRAHVDHWINELVVFGSEDSVARSLVAGNRSHLILRR